MFNIVAGSVYKYFTMPNVHLFFFFVSPIWNKTSEACSRYACVSSFLVKYIGSQIGVPFSNKKNEALVLVKTLKFFAKNLKKKKNFSHTVHVIHVKLDLS